MREQTYFSLKMSIIASVQPKSKAIMKSEHLTTFRCGSTEGQQDEVKLGVQSQVWPSNLDLPTPHSSFGNDEPVHLAHLPKIEIISAAKLFIRKRASRRRDATYIVNLGYTV